MLSLGPSSKVREMAGRAGLPRQREGPKTEEERPRTAHARNDPAAKAPAVLMGKESMRVHCSEGVRPGRFTYGQLPTAVSGPSDQQKYETATSRSCGLFPGCRPSNKQGLGRPQQR